MTGHLLGDAIVTFRGGAYDGLCRSLPYAPSVLLVRPCPPCRLAALMGVGGAECEHLDFVGDPDETQLGSRGPFDATYRVAYLYEPTNTWTYVRPHLAHDRTPTKQQ